MNIQFADLKKGDVVSVTTAAHQAPSRGLRGGPLKDVPEQTVLVQIDAITGVNGQPGRQQAWCRVLVTAKGEDLRNMAPAMAPSFSFYSTQPASLPAITIKAA